MERPRVVVSVSASVDGRVALRRDQLLVREDAAAVWQSLRPPGVQAVEEDDRRRFGAQVILEGSGSLVPETAGPVDGLPEPAEPVEVLRGDHVPDRHDRWFAVVDGRGRVRWTMTSDGESHLLVLVCRATPPAYLAQLRRQRIAYLVAGDERVDLGAALGRMRERLGVTRVMSQGGGGINGALLRAGLVDELWLTVLPVAIGGRGTPSVFDGVPLADGAEPDRLRLLSTHAAADGTLRLHYAVEVPVTVD
ncbi:riboflavin biosynthesis pyrimidine reductase [Actinoplanes octamycinicus]|uniref:Riboflavin biosynthesis pyrimidine reductase n=1 Tax=Actinoplanes octamycinicus TaxID=135948 RepID=A0A7W7H7Q7_9ACTN|nr:dihydrofolate reductase family protein [Actinoplanes octamycinicus]MBB4745377.1 riboflavin biosynthesis pyrimidine reductase [Actinoplanes octamycinicus]GIE56217.1 pyrimidine reductase [Actinoplanes octamycinicus]